MDQNLLPAGRVQSPSEAEDVFVTPFEQPEPNALDVVDARIDIDRAQSGQSEGETRHLATHSGDAGIAPHSPASAGRPDREAAAAIPTSEPDTRSPLSPSPARGSGSLATTAVSSPASHRRFLPAPESERGNRNSDNMSLLATLAKFAAFTVSFATLEEGLHAVADH